MNRKRILKIDEKAFVEPLYLSKYSAMAQELSSLYPALTINEPFLSMINYQIQVFMENELGMNSSKPSGLVKLPAKLFSTKDFKANSALFVILREAIDLMIRLNWSSFDLSPIERKNDGLSLIQNLHKVLAERKLIIYPCIYFSKVPYAEASDLRDIVLKRMGSISSTEEDATHIIEWSQDAVSNAYENGDDYARIVDTRADGAKLVHYCYLPDSYEDWVNDSSLSSETELSIDMTDNTKRKKWKLSSRFITDVDIYNEWGNELDYEIEEGVEADMTVASIGSSTQPNKRFKLKLGKSETSDKASTLLEAVSATEKSFQDVAPPSKAQKAVIYDAGLEASQSSLSIQSISSGKRKAETMNDMERKIPRSSKIESLSIDSNTVGATELRYLSELFLSPQKISTNDYMTIRNQIISIYRLNPTVYLSATDCRQKLTGDVGIVLLVHEFLDFFGAINGDVKPECKPAASPSLTMSFNTDLLEKTASSPEDYLSASDKELVRQVNKHGSDWSKVSSEMRANNINMDAIQCLHRFASLTAPKRLISEDSSQREQSTENRVRIQLMTKDYMDARLSVLETKMQLLTSIQGALGDERERLEIERRDLAIQKAQFSFTMSNQSGKLP